ncbi:MULTISPECIES: hypothetical protein [Ralstonia solanacearum species complex]|uniref:hypothetical protein n=1 Tax=Ralstonia phage RS138 TaxID=1483485 RepID=UPI0006BD23C3|nr:hypothetical protein [Ralstonia solanacearum]YP_009226527.1 hypothetical protein AXI85_gp23 [Ralstonia phage RS138]BEU73996.1 hypothetical protein MAFF211271_35510 [Ralstonia pseudosolanacearum]AXV78906.1 hypothetical protein CJO76_18070 [Ralstonia solanacearum]AXV92928.1 hypothetical protein CJO79_18055 [Ralstonia solanacearum]AXW20990.1 hypothetical protein CJO85_18100 [Ralstonia solanacearum]AXW77826.1 hypothetical protein CJO97_18050 [Ralstonia solanacearum]
MATLTREQIIAIDYELSRPYGMARLECDGYRVDVHVERAKGLSYILMVYVNGGWHPAWTKGECEEAKRFMRPVSRSLFTAKRKADLTKAFGKRGVKQAFPDLDKKITQYMPTWSSAKPMLRHFLKTCSDISLVHIGYPLSTEKAA